MNLVEYVDKAWAQHKRRYPGPSNLTEYDRGWLQAFAAGMRAAREGESDDAGRMGIDNDLEAGVAGRKPGS